MTIVLTVTHSCRRRFTSKVGFLFVSVSWGIWAVAMLEFLLPVFVMGPEQMFYICTINTPQYKLKPIFEGGTRWARKTCVCVCCVCVCVSVCLCVRAHVMEYCRFSWCMGVCACVHVHQKMDWMIWNIADLDFSWSQTCIRMASTFGPMWSGYCALAFNVVYSSLSL